MSKLNRIALTVTMADGGSYDVLINNRAMVDYEFTQAKKRWPTREQAPFLWLTYLAFAQLRHDGIYAGDDFAKFKDEDCIDIDKRDEQQAEPADPTQPADESASVISSVS